MARICYGKPSGPKFTGKDRLNALGVVTPRIELLAGAAALMAEYNGKRGLLMFRINLPGLPYMLRQ